MAYVRRVITLTEKDMGRDLSSSPRYSYNRLETSLKEYDPINGLNTVGDLIDSSQDIIVKGLVQSDDYLRTIIKHHCPKDIHTGKRNFLSHVFVMKGETIYGKHTFILTDAVLNQFPTLEQKIDITKQALSFFNTFVLPRKEKELKDKLIDVKNYIPRICFLNHSGHFNLKNKTSCDTLLLVNECERLGLKGKFYASQLDFALSTLSQSIKGAGDTLGLADIIVVNDINEGNSIMKSFLLNGWKCYGYVLGANRNVVLNSRSNLHQNIEAVDYLLDILEDGLNDPCVTQED